MARDGAMDTHTTVDVRVALATDRERWDRFVLDCPSATFFHRFGWRNVIEGAFGHRTHYLIAERGGEPVGVLPLAHMSSWLFGNALVSTPFCVYGGPAASDPHAAGALVEEAAQLARSLRVDYLELRNREPLCSGWPTKDLYVTFRRAIAADNEANFQAIPRKQRAMVRKGIEAGLAASVSEDVDAQWRAYSESVRNLGTPVFAKRYFRLLKEEFGPDCEILTVHHDGRLAAGVMSFYFRDEVLPYYGGGTATARDLYANDFMYWEVMRRATMRGVRLFDYGRSKRDTGSYRFKKHWGFEPAPLYYQYFLVRARSVPDLSPNNPRFRLLIGMWKRMPLALTRWIGPPLARNLG
jgi:FemAB-related protein (PEP-CTERM system-associated)